MTRFLMSLYDSVDLVLYAFKNGMPGDIFVQKSPATTVDVLAEALMQIMSRKVPIEIIGTRHGEKKHETLVSREEMARADDLDQYYRINADNRDLNYLKYTETGNIKANALDDYTSENTEQLDVAGTVSLLTNVPYILEMINSYKN